MYALFFLTIEPDADPRRRRVRRRVRRRTRHRIRRRIRWRMINGVRVVVVPLNIEIGDEFIMDNGSIGTITAKTEKNITVTVKKEEQTLPVVYDEPGEESGEE